MKLFILRNSSILVVVLFILRSGSAQIINAPAQYNGGGEYLIKNSNTTNCISSEERNYVRSIVKENIEKLNIFQSEPEVKSRSQVKLDWPVRPSDQLFYNSYYTIANYVDLNPDTGSGSFNQFGETNLDYNCGNRSYDNNSGYNHSGIDIFPWPFSWYLMKNDLVEVVAAESGYIVYKEDGYFDQNCGCDGTFINNSIIIQHSDGSLSWYGHMKKFSLNDKVVGDYISKGEYLGIVGSSGCSTGPHLHFEITDSKGEIIEPFSGPCNNTTSSSWWTDQLPYKDPQLNALFTHYDYPDFNPCVGIDEDPKISNQFQPGDLIVMAAYYRDQPENEPTNYRIRRPDGTLLFDWVHSSPQSYYQSGWYWYANIPLDAECGEWIWEADFYGSKHKFPFQVGESISAQIAASGSTEFCEGESVELTAGGGIAYQWTGPNGFLSNNQTITADQSGTYQVEVRNAANCADTKSQIITVYSDPAINGIDGNINPDANTTENYIIDEPNLNSVYNWSIMNGTILSGQGTSNIEVEWSATSDAEICVQENDTNNCISEAFCITVEILTTSTENILKNKINLYPNPTFNNLFIEGISFNDISEMMIINSYGQNVMLKCKQANNNIEVSLEHLDEGMYFLSFRIGNSKVAYKVMKINNSN